ncbi:MAG: hypothetical protein ACRCWQ_03690, partial [Bacilli bacterium]
QAETCDPTGAALPRRGGTVPPHRKAELPGVVPQFRTNIRDPPLIFIEDNHERERSPFSQPMDDKFLTRLSPLR